MREQTPMGRFSVQFVVANDRDVMQAAPGVPIPAGVKHLVLSGVVDSGAARLVLPQGAVDELRFPGHGETTVRYADGRRERRPVVSHVWLQLLGRDGVFSAVVEPDRTDALIGAIVLEELDLVVDCTTQTLHPREPDSILTEIE
jgi:predicted aspartyl protease